MQSRPGTRGIAFGIALLVGLALAAGAQAQARQEEKANIVITGDIKAVDPVTRTITIKSTNDDGIRYDVEAAASIMSGFQTLNLADLKLGWNVAANGHDLRGKKTLTYIKVVKAPSP